MRPGSDIRMSGRAEPGVVASTQGTHAHPLAPVPVPRRLASEDLGTDPSVAGPR